MLLRIILLVRPWLAILFLFLWKSPSWTRYGLHTCAFTWRRCWHNNLGRLINLKKMQIKFSYWIARMVLPYAKPAYLNLLVVSAGVHNKTTQSWSSKQVLRSADISIQSDQSFIKKTCYSFSERASNQPGQNWALADSKNSVLTRMIWPLACCICHSVYKFCKSGNFCQSFILANSVERHICDVKNFQLGHDLPISVNDILILLFREDFIFTNFHQSKLLRK